MVKSRSTRLGDICRIFDGPHATPNRVDEGPYFLNIASLSQGRLDLSKSDHVSPQEFTKWTRRVTPQENDLLFSYETRLGEAALMPPGVGACLGRRMALMRLDHQQVDSQYFLYYYLSPEMQKLIEARTIHGATVNRIALSTMAEWKVCLPSLPEQRAIAQVLGALDDKIAANTKLARTAIELTEAYFRRSMSQTTCAGTLGDLLSLEYGKALPADRRNPGCVPVYGSGGVVGLHDQAIADGPGVIIGRKGTAGAVHWSAEAFYPIDTTFFVLPKADGYSSLFCYFMLKSLPLTDHNSDSAVPGLNRKEALAFKMRVPGVEVIEGFTRAGTPLFAAADAARQESEMLARTRDTLLPQLMSGKIRVRDAEQLVEEVV